LNPATPDDLLDPLNAWNPTGVLNPANPASPFHHCDSELAARVDTPSSAQHHPTADCAPTDVDGSHHHTSLDLLGCAEPTSHHSHDAGFAGDSDGGDHTSDGGFDGGHY